MKTPKTNIDGFLGSIISIGPQTDSVIDHFELSDTLVPRLRHLSKTVRSSRWEAALHASDWGLSSEQAVKLSSALLLDIELNAEPSMVRLTTVRPKLLSYQEYTLSTVVLCQK